MMNPFSKRKLFKYFFLYAIVSALISWVLMYALILKFSDISWVSSRTSRANRTSCSQYERALVYTLFHCAPVLRSFPRCPNTCSPSRHDTGCKTFGRTVSHFFACNHVSPGVGSSFPDHRSRWRTPSGSFPRRVRRTSYRFHCIWSSWF